MQQVASKDGTKIAVDVLGAGPPVVFVDAALGSRSQSVWNAVARLLSNRFTTYRYDRRGRGSSEDSKTIEVQQEIDDLAAVCALAKSPPRVVGLFAGSVLSLRAAGAGVAMDRVITYELPFLLDGKRKPKTPNFGERVRELLGENKREEAIQTWYRNFGVSVFAYGALKAFGVIAADVPNAHTLLRDLAVLGDTLAGGPMPAELKTTLQAIKVPAHICHGFWSPRWAWHNAKVVAAEIPGGQTHSALLMSQGFNPTLMSSFIAKLL